MTISRRRFLELSAVSGLLAVPSLSTSLPLSPSTAPVPPVGAVTATDGVRLGLFPQATGPIEAGIHEVLGGVDWSWLKRGDSVFVKLASNSGEVHPATTSPAAVRAMVRALKDRGAGRVVVGDQSGVASVRLIKDGQRVGSTRALFQKNGLYQAIVDSGAEVHCFEEHGFHDGYVMAALPRPTLSSSASSSSTPSSVWRRQPFIARIVEEVDHIVYLPRLSAHTLCGYTHGHKLAVGFLRDDSRHVMHNDAGTIYEKYTELNYCRQIQQRLRLTVTVAEAVLTEGGPDGGRIALADPRIVLASTHLANHDAVSVGMLTWAKARFAQHAITAGLPFGAWSSLTNLAFVSMVGPTTGLPWTSDDSDIADHAYAAHDFGRGVAEDRGLRYAYELLGGMPSRIAVDVVGTVNDDALAWLQQTLPVQRA